MEAGCCSSMTLSICLQPLHDRIFTSGLWVCRRAHVSGIRGNFFWPAQLFSSGLWMPARLAAKHQGASAKKMQNIHFFHVIADLWNHFHHLPRKDYGQMGGASGKHLSLYISANRNSDDRWSIALLFYSSRSVFLCCKTMNFSHVSAADMQARDLKGNCDTLH